jgi:hypothetical protein
VPSGAWAERPLAQRWAQTAHGSIAGVGNTVITCNGSDSGCGEVRAGLLGDNAGPSNRVWADADTTSVTFNSSRADLALPSGATVLHAELLWGGKTAAGTGSGAQPAPDPASRGTILFNPVSSGGYRTITAGWLDDLGDGTYSAGADITSIVAVEGATGYIAGNVQTGTGAGAGGGWSIVVAYQLATKPLRRLQMLDGLSGIDPLVRPSLDVTLSDFVTPASGTVTGRMVLVGASGTRGSSDTVTLGGVSLAGDGSPDDMLNSSVAGAKDPMYTNSTGMEVEDTSLTGILAPAVDTTTLRLASTTDDFFLTTVALATDESAPQAATAPAITGEARDTVTLTGARGAWRATAPVTYAQQWQRCDASGANCADVSGATGNNLSLASGDVGSTFRFRVVATNAAGTTTATSAATAPVVADPPAATTAPSVSGTTRDGQTMTANRGTWTGTPTVGYTYQWRRCDTAGNGCTDIAGETGSAYALTPSDVGGRVRVVVTGTNAGGAVPATSAASTTVVADPPANALAPVISGIQRDGQTLLANRGTWTGTPTITYAYQWRRCDSSGSGCSDIAGASTSVYTLTSADVDSRIRVRVTATNGGGSVPATSAAADPVAPDPPANGTPPTISGVARDGQTLLGDRGTWLGTPTLSYSYQWRRCDSAGSNCTDIPGATTVTYDLRPADVGATVRFGVVAINAGGSTTATSSSSAVVNPDPPTNTTAPAITGTLRDTQNLTATAGTWTGTPTISYAYRWRRCDSGGAGCSDIPGATVPTYGLKPADVGSTLRVVVTATNAGGSAPQTSAATGVVAPDPAVATTRPSIAGTPQDNRTLSGDDGTWTGTPTLTYARQWQRCDASGTACVAVAGATGTTYVLTPADIGSTIRFRVTATNAAGPVGALSAATGTVAADPPSPTSSPVITGTVRDTQTLTSSRGSWSGTPPDTYSFQWRRCDASGASCVDIAGATNQTYVLTPADVDSTIRTRVTASNGAGSSNAVTNATGTVAPDPPANTVAPSFTGTERDTQTLTAARGTWTGTPTLTYAYRWRRCDITGSSCADIVGATTSTYALSPADVGQTVRVVVTATNAGASTPATSAASGAIAPDPAVNTAAPSISGVERDSQTLLANRGTWTGTPTLAYAYQWQRCDTAGASCADIAGATTFSYVLTAADVGATVRVRVTASNAAGPTTRASAATGTIAPDPPAATTAPIVAAPGGAQDAQTLTADRGAWSGTPTITYAYQWLRCAGDGGSCAAVTGATTASYALSPSDVDSTLRVRVTASNGGGPTVAVSAASAKISAAPPAVSSPPTVSGVERDTQTLSASAGTWTGTPAITYAYQWRRCDGAGAGCVDIAGANAATYRLAPADVDSTVRVVVTATNAGGVRTATSSPTGAIAADGPAATTAPSVSGVERDSQTLIANRGTWTGTPTIAYTYRWRRCDTTGAACSDIPGATTALYTLTPADVDWKIRVQVTAANTGGVTPATSAATGLVAPDPPGSTTAPAITGTARDGRTLTADRGTWTGTPELTYAYAWTRCDNTGASCNDIAGAASSTYTLTPQDVAATVRVRVTARNAGGPTPATSAATRVIAPDPPTLTAAPSIGGTERDTQTLTADRGTWTGTPELTYAYAWTRCDNTGASCNDIAGAASSTYTLTPQDVAATVRVRVTARNAGGPTPATSAATRVIAPDPPTLTAAPSIGGTERDTQTLTADRGTWTGTPQLTYTYRWTRCDNTGASCNDIAGATDATYRLTPADVGGKLRVRVTASNGGGSTPATSGATQVIAPDPAAATTAPSISGTERDTQTLTADRGTWTGTPQLTYTYRWTRCDNTGASCNDIAGATDATYTLTPQDVGGKLRVRVTASNGGGSTPATSGATQVIAPDPAAATTAPSISGTERDTQTLTADRGTWTGTPQLTYTYRWIRCDAQGDNCNDIAGATDPTYTLTPDDVDRTIRVRVTATNQGGPKDVTSAATTKVTADAPAATERPSTSGPAMHDAEITAAQGSWTGTPDLAFAYQWRRCDAAGDSCTNIAGATRATYSPSADDIGSRLRVVVTAANAGGTETSTSLPTQVVRPAPPINVAAPTTTGKRSFDADTLVADGGQWTGTRPLGLGYAWQRCDADLTECTSIPGAKGKRYVLTDADEGLRLRVVVTATNVAGDDVARSQPTAPYVAVPVTQPAPPAEPEPEPVAPKPALEPAPAPAAHAPLVAEVPAAPAPAQPTATPAAADLIALPGSLVAATACQTLSSGAGISRIDYPESGPVRLRVRADGMVTPQAPVSVRLSAAHLSKLRVQMAIDGRPLKPATTPNEQSLSLTPALLRGLGKHRLTVELRRPDGTGNRVIMPLETVPCQARFTTAFYRTRSGTALRMRMDSFKAMASVGFDVPAALALHGDAKPRLAGRLRIVAAGDRSRTLRLTLPAQATSGTLFTRADGLTVRFSPTGLQVEGLPPKVGIAELTVFGSAATVKGLGTPQKLGAHPTLRR